MRDWTRVIWASEAARLVWEPRIVAVQEAWFKVEVTSVERGMRHAGLVFGRPRTSLPCLEVSPNRFAIGRIHDLADAYACGDNRHVGRLLGYPECCLNFFDRTWAAGALDTTEQMAGDGNGPIGCNILGRWIGVRMVMHLPCSWTCRETVRLAAYYRELWPPDVFVWVDQILNWPMEWSARHGIAEVRYPVLKLSTRTTMKPGTAVVRRRGQAPIEAATGLHFPHPEPRRLLVLDTAHANGFSSRDAMNTAHDMVLNELATSPPRGLTLDLGCGTGHLQRRVAQVFGVPILGIEADAARAGRYPDIRVQDLRAITELPTGVDTILVSQRRFEEIPDLQTWCFVAARQVLVYSYDAPMFAQIRKVA